MQRSVKRGRGVKWFNCLLLIAVLIFLFSFPRSSKTITETITYRDTVRDTTVKLIREYITRYDTITLNDTQYVYVPISTYEFKDTNYRIIVEGYRVKPLLIETYPITKVETKEIEKRIRIAPIVGIGAIYGTKGVDIGIIAGVGLTIKF